MVFVITFFVILVTFEFYAGLGTTGEDVLVKIVCGPFNGLTSQILKTVKYSIKDLGQTLSVNSYTPRETLESPSPNDPFPEEIDSVLETRHGKTHLSLKQHHSSCSLCKVGATAQRCIDCSVNIPVYTLQEINYEETIHVKLDFDIRLDNFQRTYVNHSRTYIDNACGASFLVVHNSVSNSYKFFGSLRIGGERYTVQPSKLDELNVMETAIREGAIKGGHHMLKKSPTLEYSADHMGLFLLGNPIEDSFATAELPTAATRVTISGTTHQSSATTSKPTFEDNGTTDSQFFNDISPGSTANVTGSTQNENKKTDTSYLESRRSFNESQMEAERDVFDLTELLRRQGKYWYHKSFKRDKELTSQTPTTTKMPDDPVNRKVVEVFIVCDFLCYKKFQGYYKVTDPVATKNAIAQYFTYVRDFHEVAYSGLIQDFPDLGLSLEVRVVGLYIATSSSHKVIGDYVIGDNKEVDSAPSLFEFVLWVEDSLKPRIKADHYALVTGYNLSGESNFILGLVSNIPSVCQLDSVSLAELWLPITASVMTHELGHSLGADHDGLTNGFCQDQQQYIMAAVVGGAVPEENVGNAFRFSNCSALFFQAALQDKKCLERDDFRGSPLPSIAPPVGQMFTLDEQCATLVNNSYTCRENISTSISGSWDGICSNNLCRLPQTVDNCFEMIPLQFTSCGNKRWCVDGVCVEDAEAPEKPVDCPAGDSGQLACNATQCVTGEYDDVTRFVSCCETCKPLKTERFVVISSNV